jgi:hypothetical protein
VLASPHDEFENVSRFVLPAFSASPYILIVRLLCAALLLLPSMSTITRAADDPAPFSESDAVLLNVSERDLNRILVDSFHANGGPRFEGGKARVNSSVSDLRYHALFSDPVVRLGTDGSAHVSLDILDASLRIGRLERKIAGRQARCEEAGLDVDPQSPLAVDLLLGLSVSNGALRVNPTSVEIPDADKRLLLVEPERCKNTPLPRWLLWSLGKSYFRRSVGNLDKIILERARKSAVRFEAKESLLTSRWELPKARHDDLGPALRLFPETLDMSGGSLLVGLTASTAGPTDPSAPVKRVNGAGLFPSSSFLGLSESFVNEISRRVVSSKSKSQHKSTGRFRKLLASDAAYTLVPGLRRIDSKENVSLDVSFPSAPRFEFRSVDEGGSASSGSQAMIRVLLSGVQIDVRKDEGGRKTVLGSIHVDSVRMSVVPFMSVLGGISFRIVENTWKVSSTGLEFDEDLVAATLQEITFGKIFATSYEPLLKRALRLGETEFVPQSFAVREGYLVIALGEPRPREAAGPAAAAMRTGTPLGSR